VGAVVVSQNRLSPALITKPSNSRMRQRMLKVGCYVGAHFLGSKYLTECTLYVTLEPCVMCAGALHWTQLQNWYLGPRMSSAAIRWFSSPLLHPGTEVIKGSNRKNVRNSLTGFQENKRNLITFDPVLMK